MQHFSPALFIIVHDVVMRKASDVFADDVLICESEEQLQDLTTRVVEGSKNYVLHLNTKKTKVMVTTWNAI